MSDIHQDHDDEFSADEEVKSKSQLKREMHALQEMGTRLTALKPEQLARIPMSERLRDAVLESHRIKQNEAIRRHRQRLGKLMRSEDAEAIGQALAELDSSTQAHARKFHELEHWRDRLINGGPDAVTAYLSEFRQAEAQHLRQLVRNACKDAQEGKNRRHGKKLFQYLREVQELEQDLAQANTLQTDEEHGADTE